jgi:hypothetical protein
MKCFRARPAPAALRLQGAPDRKPFGWETGAPQTGCFDDLGIRESVPGGPPEPFVTIQLTIVDVLGCWE